MKPVKPAEKQKIGALAAPAHLLAPGSRVRAKFEHLCLVGCDSELLLGFLTLAVYSARHKRTIYDLYKVSQPALVKLPNRLEEIGRDLERVNRLLGDHLRARFVDNPQIPNESRSRVRQQADLYQEIPKLLRVLALDLRAANAWLTKYVGPRRLDTFRHQVLQLLQYVDTCTNSPHYDDVSELLDHFFSREILGTIENLPPRPERTSTKKKKSDTPSLIESPAALKALYHRSAEYGFLHSRPHHRKGMDRAVTLNS